MELPGETLVTAGMLRGYDVTETRTCLRPVLQATSMTISCRPERSLRMSLNRTANVLAITPELA
jgi:hypothetical protein